ncbi:MAG TPA: squalene/phytoene synthase family protein [Mycobacteriales bacterium]|nr:squalene/phytoene synthase family protein [Mycobacteriales bacterium]
MTGARPASGSMPLRDAYEVCAAITTVEAGNFSYGIRLLPREKRDALSAVYALARRIDDIADGELVPAAERAAELDRLRDAIAGPPPADDPVLVAVADAAGRLPIPLGAFGELIDGAEMDIAGRRYETFAELETYCRCVAGTVGRLCLGVFGTRTPHPDAPLYADQLGIALQQANILRDLREDLLNGRVYVPAEDLDRFGVTLRLDPAGRLADEDGSLARLIRFSAERARRWFAEGGRLIPLLDRRSAASAGAMAGIYAALLDRIAADPTRVYGGRLSLPVWQKAAIAGRALTGLPR